MGVNTAMAGRVYPPSPGYEVAREKIVEFAAAIGSDDPVYRDPAVARALGHRDVVAPPTFAVIVAQRCEAQFLQDPASGVDFSRVVHGEERFRHQRPITAGDVLVATLHIDLVREVGGNGVVTTRVEIADPDGVAVSTVVSTLVVRGEQ